MAIALDAVITDKIGFATHQNAAPILRQLSVHNLGVDAVDNVTVTLRSDPAFLAEKVWRFDQIRPDTEIAVTDRDVRLSASVLAGLTEAVSATVILTAVDVDGHELASTHYPIELLAHNEWGGIGAMADLLPAFVMPNDPAVDRVLKAASDGLRRMGKPDQIDGYESKQRTRVWQLASAIWSAVAGLRLSYALPPAGFEQTGQKIRTPSQILDGRVATCLDVTLLFAAALEQARLNPLIVMTKGHAFVGVWLQPSEFSSLTTDEAAALRRRFNLDELIVFETTLVTQKNPASFTQAIAAGFAQIHEQKDADFELAIDIRRARMQKIRPLGVAKSASAASDENAPPVSEAVDEPPILPAFDQEVTDEVVTPTGRVKNWQRRLLNLTTANRLLHLSETAKAIWLSCPDPGNLEDILAAGKKVRIKPMPELGTGGRDEELYNQQTISDLRAEVGQEALDRGEVLAALPKDKLDAQLVDLFRKAKSDIDEGGANTLFLAIGFLKWKKSNSETRSYRAPLILLPVKLDRKSAVSGVVMSLHEDEPRFNLTLLELLRQDFELTIPKLEGDLPTDHSGLDVPLIWRLVRDAVKDMPGFEVVDDVALGTFSFAKYLMWKDLIDREDKLRESPLVKLLIDRDGQLKFDTDRLPRVEDLDVEVEPADLFIPLAADSSQIRAVIASARGQNFVLNGPPGTGKSQTIANMIAHNLALGRRVLFVAEKRAALDVVHRRLTDKGLAPFCLELHSAKATKTAVIKQLGAAWDTRDAMTGEQWHAQAGEAKALRDKLNDTVAALHRQEDNGYSIHKAIGLFLRDGSEITPKFAFLATARHTLADMEAMRDVSRRLGFTHRDVADLPAELANVSHSEWSHGWQEQVVVAARSLPGVLDEFEEALQGLASASRLPKFGNDLTAARRLLELTELCLSAFGCDLTFAFAPDVADKLAAARKMIELLEVYRAEEVSLSAACEPEVARRLDLDGFQARWAEAQQKFWFFASLAKRKVARELTQSAGATGPLDLDADFSHLTAMKKWLVEIDQLTPKVSAFPEWQGLATRKASLNGAIELALKFRQVIASQAESTDTLIALREAVSKLVVYANELLSDDGAVARSAARLRAALARTDEAISTFEQLCRATPGTDFGTLRVLADTITRCERRLRDWANWRRVRDEAIQLELSPLVSALEEGSVHADRTEAEFEIGYARWFALQRMDAEPLLRNFQVGEHADAIARFRKIDDRMSELASQYIRAKICGSIPAKDDVPKSSGYGALRHQLQLQRPSKAIRQLAAEMGEAFTQLAPCMLMSPLSIAQYLPAGQALFDLVIFDEASQITPWDAIGAMARGKQVIIAGDPQQMPPTNDFQKQGNATNEEDDTEEDMDSILEECLGAGVPEINLDWHYRSRHESLITFSNSRYYGNRLVTFPAPDTRPSAVSWRKVDGVFAKGKERTNAIEAQAIVDEAVRYLRDPNFVDEKGRPLSLGIITMNIQQMSLVERLLDTARARYPGIERHFSDDRLEPVCVRNLETAQGDERDVILLGVSFGPTEPGGKTMSMHFGKLNGNGGPRRLNVAVTRARREMKVFTSFEPGMIDLTRTSKEGMRDLRDFLEFARGGKDALASADKGSLGGYDSPFEEAVAQDLRRRGWQVVPQVGVSKFRIDLGIVHPDFPGDFLLGVECDGATYHSAATARDRDKVRAAILEGLGWQLLRVWSTEWWFNRERASDQLHLGIVRALEENRRVRAERVSVSDVEPVIDEAPAYSEPEYDAAPRDERQRVNEPKPVAKWEFAHNASDEPTLPIPDAPGDDVYHFADFTDIAPLINAEIFYEASYYPVLRKLVAHVVQQEGPIAESQLVNRIARAHGFQRSGNRIHNRVMHLARNQHFVASDGGTEPFVWSSQKAAAMGVPARLPASDDQIRQIEQIAKAELRATGLDDPVEIARLFGIRRLTATARARIEAALTGK